MSVSLTKHSTLLDALSQRVIIFDGSMGATILNAVVEKKITPEDFGGFIDCTDALALFGSEKLKDIHRSFLSVGVDAVETDTFNGADYMLDEHGLGDRAYELNKRAAEIAREACDEFTTPDRPRWVIGSMGPGTKTIVQLPGQTWMTYDAMYASYYAQAKALIDGGVDALLVETCFDILQCKCAVAACHQAANECDRRIVLMAQVTVETVGTLLLGTEAIAAITALEMMPLDVIGLNCGSGPDLMHEHVRTFSRHSSKYISVLPNAGLPENVGGKTFFPLPPEALGEWQTRFVREYGVNIVGGCCGTTPAHLKCVVDSVWGEKPAPRTIQHIPAVSSLFQTVAYDQELSVLIVGESANATGSRKFRDLLLAGDMDGIVSLAQGQEREGAHVIDLCVDYVGRDRVEDIKGIADRLGGVVRTPVMVDSDSADERVYEEALKRLPGKCLVNSINYEDGGKKIAKVLPVCRKYGAGVVCLTIEESGQPHDVEGKLRVARRLYDAAVNDHGLLPEDLFFDTLTFPLSTGQEEYRKDGIATIEAIRQIKAEMPGVRTILGVSNCSFGLAPAARQVLNSVFLHYAKEAGLDAAIINASKIIPLAKIPADQAEAAKRLVFDERTEEYDPLQVLMSLFEGEAGKIKKLDSGERYAALTLEQRLTQHIIDGEKNGLIAILDAGLEKYPALEIVNTYLLDGMKVVGELFGSGQMQLPFVLQSAEVMKRSVAHLEPHMEKSDQPGGKGTIVLATVKGDVHDIGKNLVDIILSNNGYQVENIGIKQPISNVIEAAQRVNADAIGLSGLLVKSTVVMKEDLEELNDRNLSHYPVILGGAALTRKYVERDLRELYNGNVYYAADAFDGLRLMDGIKGHGPLPEVAEPVAEVVNSDDAAVDEERERRSNLWNAVSDEAFTYVTEPTVRRDVSVPIAPFFGSKVVRGIDLRDVYPYINKNMLFRGHWQFRRGKRTHEEYEKFTQNEVVPIFEDWKLRAVRENIMHADLVYGYFPASSNGNDLIVYDPQDHDKEIERFTFPRQLRDPKKLCLSDYFAPVAYGKRDIVAFHLVTIGHTASKLEKELMASGDYRDYLYLHGLSVETAEALAEYWHKKIRTELGIADEDNPDVSKLFAHGYRGQRYSFGYPACPNLEDQTKLFKLLDPSRIDVTLSEEFMMEPEQSTSAIIIHHPDAKYFGVE